MISHHSRFIICGILIFVLSIACIPTAMAAPSLQWETEKVYFDRGSLFLEGYFYNNGTRTITWVNWHDINVYFKRPNTQWWHHAAATFRGLNLYLPPGETKRWTFQIYDVRYTNYQYWRVNWDVNFNYN